jgi:LmbE family N-acetylglucosaminyl deacetylase
MSCVSVLVAAAHPDDEFPGLSLLLHEIKGPFLLVHVTDGAPRSGEDARTAGCSTWKEYAEVRRRELKCALSTAGVREMERKPLNAPDQEGLWHIAEHARRLAFLITEILPGHIYTRAYESGHPDHDAAAGAVHAAVWMADAKYTVAEFAGRSRHRAMTSGACRTKGGCITSDFPGRPRPRSGETRRSGHRRS